MSAHISPLLFVFLALGFCSCFVRGDDETAAASPAAASGLGPQQSSVGQTKPLGALLETGGFSINNGYGLTALLDHNGSPNANVKLYSGGRLGPGATYFYKDAVESAAVAPAQPPYAMTESSWSVGLGSTVVAGVLVALILWNSCLWLVGGSTKSLTDLHDGKDVKGNTKDVKIRKRRALQAIQKDSEHLTRLADIVLSAIESGQCMQRSVCLLGTQLGAGTSKSMLAATVLEKMIPASAQESVYFTTLQAALRGKLPCDKIRCGGLVDSSK